MIVGEYGDGGAGAAGPPGLRGLERVRGDLGPHLPHLAGRGQPGEEQARGQPRRPGRVLDVLHGLYEDLHSLRGIVFWGVGGAKLLYGLVFNSITHSDTHSITYSLTEGSNCFIAYLLH